jgi:hypothetical protein
MAFSRNITVKRMFLYWIAQFAGGLCGGGILAAAVGPQNYISGIGLAESVTAGQGEHAGLLDCPSPCFLPAHSLFVHRFALLTSYLFCCSQRPNTVMLCVVQCSSH